MSMPWCELTLTVDYEPGEGFSVRGTARHRYDLDNVDQSPWYDQLAGDELLDVMATMCEQAWERKPLDGAPGDPELPFD